MQKQADSVLAGFNLYTHMAHFVAKELGLRPSELLDEWSVPELIVAYGEYANEIAQKNYKQWESLDVATRTKIPRPPKYYVQFIGVEEMMA